MTLARTELGRYWEGLARAYLETAGLVVIATGYRCRFGELDLVCEQSGALVVVEVRARRRSSPVSALESVDSFKQRRIIATTRHFLMTHPDWAHRPLRFDVLAISSHDDKPQIQWVSSAFEAN